MDPGTCLFVMHTFLGGVKQKKIWLGSFPQFTTETLKKWNAWSMKIMKCGVHIKDRGRTPLDCAIACGKLEIAKFLSEKGGRPNLEVYCHDREDCNPVFRAVIHGHTDTLKWVFVEDVCPLYVLNVKDEQKMTPLYNAIIHERLEIATFLQRLPIHPVFLAMQRAKRDYHQCVLRRLPDELLDMIVDKVAVRFHLEVVW